MGSAPLQNAVSFGSCAHCSGVTRTRLNLSDPIEGKCYSILECSDCGKFAWVEEPARELPTKAS